MRVPRRLVRAPHTPRLGRVLLALVVLGLVGACAPSGQSPAAKPESQSAPQVFGDHLSLFGFGVVTTNTMLAERSEVVEALAKATQRGWEYLMKSPERMISLVGHYDQLRRTAAVEEVATNRFVE